MFAVYEIDGRKILWPLIWDSIAKTATIGEAISADASIVTALQRVQVRFEETEEDIALDLIIARLTLVMQQAENQSSMATALRTVRFMDKLSENGHLDVPAVTLTKKCQFSQFVHVLDDTHQYRPLSEHKRLENGGKPVFVGKNGDLAMVVFRGRIEPVSAFWVPSVHQSGNGMERSLPEMLKPSTLGICTLPVMLQVFDGRAFETQHGKLSHSALVKTLRSAVRASQLGDTAWLVVVDLRLGDRKSVV